MPFRQAAEQLAFFWGVVLSEATVRRHSEAAGAAYVALQTAEAERLEREIPTPPAGPAVQQLSADGAMVPLVGGVWAEAKTLAIGTIRAAAQVPASPAEAVHATELSYFSRRAEHHAFTRLALVETHRRGTERAGVVVGVMDGSDWLQKVLDYHRPDTVRILDFPHVLEHLSGAAQATFGPGTAQTSAWLEDQAKTLKSGQPEAVLAALRALPTGQAAAPAAACEARDATLAYLEKRLEQIRYAEFLALGYPIGSGLVESANKLVVEARLKGSGMHWAPEHVDPMLALRTIACSGRWAEAWPQICARLRQQARDQRAARRAARQQVTASPSPSVEPAPAPQPAAPRQRPARTPLMVDGRPTLQHPWKRGPFLADGRAKAEPKL
jgi:hypothetical protein